MILSQLRDYVRARGEVNLQDLALHFEAEPDAVRGMLARWVAKGLIEKRMIDPACGLTCSQCRQETVEWYVWRGDPDRRNTAPSPPQPAYPVPDKPKP